MERHRGRGGRQRAEPLFWHFILINRNTVESRQGVGGIIYVVITIVTVFLRFEPLQCGRKSQEFLEYENVLMYPGKKG